MSLHLSFDKSLLNEKIDRAFITSEEPQRPLFKSTGWNRVSNILNALAFAVDQVKKRVQHYICGTFPKDDWCDQGQLIHRSFVGIISSRSKIEPRLSQDFFQSEQGKLFRKIILTAQKYRIVPNEKEEKIYETLKKESENGTCRGKAYAMLKISHLHKEPLQLLESISSNDILFHQSLHIMQLYISHSVSFLVKEAKICLPLNIQNSENEVEKSLDSIRDNLLSALEKKSEASKSKRDKRHLQKNIEKIKALFAKRAQRLETFYHSVFGCYNPEGFKIEPSDKVKIELHRQYYHENVVSIDKQILTLTPRVLRGIAQLTEIEKDEFEIVQSSLEKDKVCKKIKKFGKKYVREIEKLQEEDIEQAGWKKAKRIYLHPLLKRNLDSILRNSQYKSFIVGLLDHAFFINIENLYIYDQNLDEGIAKYKDLPSLIADANNYLENDRSNRLFSAQDAETFIQPFERLVEAE